MPSPPQAFVQVADAVVREAGDVTLVLHATVANARTDGSRLVEVEAMAWNQPLTLLPRAVVDCSGEATVAALAGASVEEGAADQVPALVFTLEGVDPCLLQRGLLELRLAVRRAVEAGCLPALCEEFSLVPGTRGDDRVALKLNLPPASPDRPAWQQVTAWEREGRTLVDELQRFLIANVPSCRNGRLLSVAPQLGIRSPYPRQLRFFFGVFVALLGAGYEAHAGKCRTMRKDRPAAADLGYSTPARLGGVMHGRGSRHGTASTADPQWGEPTCAGERRHASRRRYRSILMAVFSALFGKGTSLLVNAITIPLTVRYLGNENYGLWVTISSAVTMYFVLDIGIANTLTNLISEAFTRDDRDFAASYATTAFWLISGIAALLGAATWLVWPWIHWGSLFHVQDPALTGETSRTV